MEESHLDSGFTPEAVRSELARILASHDFRATKRCQDFLKFTVEQTLAGLADGLKERTIGAAVFGRPTSYDTSIDGIVRISASEVRKRLAIYYATPGHSPELRVTLPVGGYVPLFSKIGKVPVLDAPTDVSKGSSFVSTPGSGIESVASSEIRQGYRPRRALALGIAVFVVVLAVVSIRWVDLRPPRTIVEQFWQPLFKSSTPILIVPAYAPVYLPASVPATGNPAFTLQTDQYVGGGDLVAAVQVSSMVMRLGHPTVLRIGTDLSLDDLRNTPTVLIGYSSTQWADVTKRFRFFVDDTGLGMIRDGGKPTDWYPHHTTPESHTDEDYAVISRAFDAETHAMLILISGCMQYGTEAAARLITDPELLSAALQGAPKDWQKKNLQLVIRVDVVANSPGSSKVIAAYYW
ncbi:MAG: hypothetical protein WBF14_09355 [Candidatus Acidiferrales bacterium]